MAQEIQKPANEGVIQRLVADMVRDSFCSRWEFLDARFELRTCTLPFCALSLSL
jgi:hypothetical protein